MVRAMLDEDPSLASRRGGPRSWEPLLYVCYSRYLRLDETRAPGLVETARLVLDRGADPNAYWIDPQEADGNRESALYGAVGIASNVELARMLVEAGADPNDGETPYHMVEHPGVPCAPIVFPLLNEVSRGTALAHQIDYDDLEGLRTLLDLGADPNGPNPFKKTPLHQAVFRGRGRETFDLLFEHGADPEIPDGEGRTPYAVAARTGRAEIMEILERHGANTELDGTDAFLAACARGDGKEVRRMLEGEPDLVDRLSERDTAELAEMADAGNRVGVQTMLDAGVDVNVRGRVWGEAALHRAAFQGHVDVVRLLLERGADVTLRDRCYHSSPLGWAAHAEQRAALDLLLEHPERLDLRDAVEFGKAERVAELMGETDPDASIAGGEPGVLLRAAAHGGHLDLVRILLERGADPDLRNSEGLSAADYAREQGHDAVVEALQAARS